MSPPRGDPNAPPIDLAGWVDAHGERLLRSAYLLCGDPSEAQDLVQETFLQAVKSQSRFRGESAAYTWLHGILLNLTRRHWRRRKRLVYDESVALQTAADAEHFPEADREYQRSRLVDALQQLSPEHREVIVLRFYENRKLHEIAAQAGLSVGTVKSRLHYALRCVEKLLPPEMNLFAAECTHEEKLP